MEVIFEDSVLLVLNKPAGVIVEGLPLGALSSLTDQIQAQMSIEVFPCHRLDRDTTGIVVFAKKKQGLKNVSDQFKSRSVRKTYLAVVTGNWNPAWNRVETNIIRLADGRMANADEGKVALTTFHRIAHWDDKSLLKILPKTGRTHQIRLHCLFHQCPVAGDKIYGMPKENDPPMALHASQLNLRHPGTGEDLSLAAPLPGYWKSHWLKDCPVIGEF